MFAVAQFRSVYALIKSAVGRRKPAFATRHIAAQMRFILGFVPALCAGSAVVAVTLLVLTAGTRVWPFVVVWSVALNGLSVLTIRTWLRARAEQQEDAARVLRWSVLNGAFNGVLWGAIAIVVLPGAAPAVVLTLGVGAIGTVCTAGMTLNVLPRTALAALIPLFAGTAVATWIDGTAETVVLLVLLVSAAAISAAASVAFSRRMHILLRGEAKIREQQNIIGLLLKEHDSHSSDWLWELDHDGRMIRVSSRFAEAAGLPARQLAGKSFVDIFRREGEKQSAAADEIEAQIHACQPFGNVEVQILRNEEERCWRLAGRPAHDDLGQYVGFVGMASDVTGEMLAQNRIHFLAHNDALTGLFNRENFSDRLHQSVARLERYGTPFSILYLDLDQFKSINDTRGHLAGDKLLVEVSHRIRETLRADDIAARIGGDEFGIILNNNCDSWNAAALAARLTEAVSRPYQIDGETLVIGLSVGIAIAPINGTRPDQLLRNADLALYRAKAEGKGVYRFFESQMDSEARERRVLETELRQAIKEEQFMLCYQPLISAEKGTTEGFEALLRWNHPMRGTVYPTEFIPIAEQTGLITDIGNWTIHAACLAAASWPDELSVAVNLSAKHFEHADIADIVRQALAESGLAAHRLELEVTEGLLIKDPEDVIAKLTDLKSIGVTVAMDDFGTGYSSLSSLLKFPFDKIKIDKSIVTASSEGDMARDVLRLISALGATLKMKITVEGVETQDQVDFLRGISCDNFQGYYFARPLDDIELASYLLKETREAVNTRAHADASAEEGHLAASIDEEVPRRTG